MKECNKCGVSQSLDQYHDRKSSSGKKIKRPICKTCVSKGRIKYDRVLENEIKESELIAFNNRMLTVAWVNG